MKASDSCKIQVFMLYKSANGNTGLDSVTFNVK